MKKNFLKTLFILFCLSAQAQPDSVQYEKQNTFAIKGKILPWLLGNMGGLNLTLGAEQSFFTNHSVAIEGYFHGIQDHHDDSYNGPNDTIDESKHHYSRDRALALTYRFYFDRDLRALKKFSFYLGLTGRYGYKVSTWDLGFEPDTPIRETNKYRAAGPIVGLVIRLKKRMNLDIYAGTVYNNKTLTRTYDHDLTETGKVNSWDLRLGINLSWWFPW